jgi:uncharacterized membrane protein
MMVLTPLTFSSLDWLGFAAAAVVAVLLVLGWSYRASPRGLARWLYAALKMMGVAALALCLLEPLWSGQRAKPGANLFVVLADNSQGLQVKDRGQTQHRGDILRALVQPDQAEWNALIEDHFDVRRFSFDTQLHATRDYHDLNFEGRASDLGAALRTLKERLKGRPLAGLLLLTDGNATDLSGPPPDLDGLPPVYPVVIGTRGTVRDAALSQVHLSQTAFEDAPVSVQAEVTATGLGGEILVTQLLDESGRILDSRELRVRKDHEILAVRFQWRPDKPGLSFYQVRVDLKERPGSPAGQSPVESSEATRINNQRLVAVDRGRTPHRILYVAGRPNWEYKFLNRALQEDDQIQLVALIRVARREPKFDFRGRAGETSNPLFRGFDNQSPEEVERYDQPVLARLNTRDELELRAGFPRTPEELYGYEAVILDDVEAGFFGPDQAALLQKFVSERGGGLLMLGGMECFHEGQYARTPIGNLLPVYLDRADDSPSTGGWRLDLAREGWLEPWVRLRDLESEERARRQTMPPFQVFNRVREVKPGASVVATAVGPQGKEYPALVTQRFGRGRTAAFLVGDLWRWGMRDAEARRDLDKSWRQWMRWLVSDVPGRLDFTLDPSPTNAHSIARLQARLRDAKFQPVDDANVTFEIRPAPAEGSSNATSLVRLKAEPSLHEAGLYEATFVAHQSGAYQAAARVTNAAGTESSRADLGWTTDLAAQEFRSLQPNTALLEAIAQRTGGRIVAADRLSEFARNLPRRQAPVMEAWTTPAWHTPALFGFALACFVAEWGLRRWKGWP